VHRPVERQAPAASQQQPADSSAHAVAWASDASAERCCGCGRGAVSERSRTEREWQRGTRGEGGGAAQRSGQPRGYRARGGPRLLAATACSLLLCVMSEMRILSLAAK
jgi:hypothetical protein